MTYSRRERHREREIEERGEREREREGEIREAPKWKGMMSAPTQQRQRHLQKVDP